MLVMAGVFYSAVGGNEANSNSGGFDGSLILKSVDDGNDDHTFQLLEDFSYTDPKGVKWTAPKGIQVNGASIPKFAWTLIGGPWSGKYKQASVIHDHFCETKTRSWTSVHRVFYDAMITSKVPKIKAKLMYYAVSRFGPRWTKSSVNFSACLQHYCLGRDSRSNDDEIFLKPGFCGACATPSNYDGRLVFQPSINQQELLSFENSLTKNDYDLSEIDDIVQKQISAQHKDLYEIIPAELKVPFNEIGLSQ